MSENIQLRLEALLERLQTAYDGIGHNSGRPYIYFVYDQKQECLIRRMICEQLRTNAQLTFHHLDMLRLTIRCLEGQEEQRQQLLDRPRTKKSALDSIVLLWKDSIHTTITAALASTQPHERPVIVLHGLAALYPLTNPSALMEYIADQPPRNPHNATIIPIVILVPGSRPPLASHQYYFLDQERLLLDFYRGEEI